MQPRPKVLEDRPRPKVPKMRPPPPDVFNLELPCYVLVILALEEEEAGGLGGRVIVPDPVQGLLHGVGWGDGRVRLDRRLAVGCDGEPGVADAVADVTRGVRHFDPCTDYIFSLFLIFPVFSNFVPYNQHYSFWRVNTDNITST